jgi:hypothetical protein
MRDVSSLLLLLLLLIEAQRKERENQLNIETQRSVVDVDTAKCLRN